jgi:antitoxin MazE
LPHDGLGSILNVYTIRKRKMCTQIARWGNSLAIRIPKALATELDLDESAEVEISVENGRLVLTPVRPGYTLEQLVAGISDDNLHGETDTGAPVGAEVW